MDPPGVAPYIGMVVLSSAQIEQIAKEMAVRHLSPQAVDHVSSQQIVDSQGRDAVRITITLTSKVGHQLNGDAVLDTLVAIQHRFAEQGEDRLPIVEYAEAGEVTEADEFGDAEP